MLLKFSEKEWKAPLYFFPSTSFSLREKRDFPRGILIEVSKIWQKIIQIKYRIAFFLKQNKPFSQLICSKFLQTDKKASIGSNRGNRKDHSNSILWWNIFSESFSKNLEGDIFIWVLRLYLKRVITISKTKSILYEIVAH